MGDERAWRDVVRVEKRWEETATISAKRASWKATPVATVFLACGHVLTRRGFSAPPKKKAICKRCERGEKPIPIDVVPGQYEAHPPAPPDFMMPRHITAEERTNGR